MGVKLTESEQRWATPELELALELELAGVEDRLALPEVVVLSGEVRRSGTCRR